MNLNKLHERANLEKMVATENTADIVKFMRFSIEKLTKRLDGLESEFSDFRKQVIRHARTTRAEGVRNSKRRTDEPPVEIRKETE